MMETEALLESAGEIQDGFDELLKNVRLLRYELDRGPGAREVSVAITNLETAELWLMKARFVLEEEGE